MHISQSTNWETTRSVREEMASFLCLVFLMRSHYESQAGLKLTALMPQSPQWWDCKHVLPSLAWELISACEMLISNGGWWMVPREMDWVKNSPGSLRYQIAWVPEDLNLSQGSSCFVSTWTWFLSPEPTLKKKNGAWGMACHPISLEAEKGGSH